MFWEMKKCLKLIKIWKKWNNVADKKLDNDELEDSQNFLFDV